MLFVRAANEGRTVIDRFPKEKVSEDFDQLADKLLPPRQATAEDAKPALKSLFGRRELVARA
jgi:Flp pilus assembly CpaE family ATPase